MPIDQEMIRAIKQVVRDHDQPAAVATLLIAWLEDASMRELPLADQHEHLANLRRAIEI